MKSAQRWGPDCGLGGHSGHGALPGDRQPRVPPAAGPWSRGRAEALSTRYTHVTKQHTHVPVAFIQHCSSTPSVCYCAFVISPSYVTMLQFISGIPECYISAFVIIKLCYFTTVGAPVAQQTRNSLTVCPQHHTDLFHYCFLLPPKPDANMN